MVEDADDGNPIGDNLVKDQVPPFGKGSVAACYIIAGTAGF